MLGFHHEQQHQELLVTDIKHVFAQNPLYPVFRHAQKTERPARSPRSVSSNSMKRSASIGHEGAAFPTTTKGRGIARSFLLFALASRPVTNGEYIEFIEAGGYARPEYLAFARLDDSKRTALAGAALLGEARRKMVELHPLRVPPGRSNPNPSRTSAILRRTLTRTGRRTFADGI